MYIGNITFHDMFHSWFRSTFHTEFHIKQYMALLPGEIPWMNGDYSHEMGVFTPFDVHLMWITTMFSGFLNGEIWWKFHIKPKGSPLGFPSPMVSPRRQDDANGVALRELLGESLKSHLMETLSGGPCNTSRLGDTCIYSCIYICTSTHTHILAGSHPIFNPYNGLRITLLRNTYVLLVQVTNPQSPTSLTAHRPGVSCLLPAQPAPGPQKQPNAAP